MVLQAMFSNIEKCLLSNIKNTNGHLRIAVAWFTNPNIYELLIKLLEKGKKIEIILCDDSINFTNEKVDFQKLINKGAEIRISRYPKLMHNKFCVIDRKLIISGSYNYTINAEKNNFENVIISTDISLINQFLNHFEELITQTELLISISETNFYEYPSNFDFQQAPIFITEEVNIESKSDFETEISMKEAEPDEIDEDLEYKLNEAQLYYNNCKYSKAIKKCEEVIDIYPKNIKIKKAFLIVAESNWRIENYIEQIKNAKKAVELDNEYYEAYNCLGNGYSSRKNENEATNSFKICIEAEPNEYTYYYNRALSFQRLNNDLNIGVEVKKRLKFKERADLDFKKVIELTNNFEDSPDILFYENYNLYYIRGMTYYVLGKNNQAREDLLEAEKKFHETDKMQQDLYEHKEIKERLKELNKKLSQ